MSDIVTILDLQKLENHIQIADPNKCLNYVRNQCVSSERVVFAISIPCPTLRFWYNCKAENGLLSQVNCSYIEILNYYLSQISGYKIKENCDRIEGRLRRLCGQTAATYVGANGTTFRKLNLKFFNVSVRAGEFQTIAEIASKLKEEQAKNEQLYQENEILKTRCEELYSKMTEAQMNLQQATVNIDSLQTENMELYSYIENIGQDITLDNKNKKVFEVGKRQQRRKLKELKTKIDQALWFAKTFGLELQSVNLLDEKGSGHTITYKKESNPAKAYKDLTEEEQEKVKQVLFLLDNFCVSDAAYHELTMSEGGNQLPRSYLIKQCKEQLNSLCHIIRTPGQAEGVQLDFKCELETYIRKKFTSKDINIEDPDFKLKVKLSGDGAKMSKLTNFVVISFALLNEEDAVMSSRGNHSVAIIKGQESYELLQTSCAAIFKQVNMLVKEKKISIDGKDIPLDMYLGGDYKFLLLVMGMKGATSDHGCIWCKIHKHERYDMSKSQEYYWSDNIVRTLDDIKECAKKQKYSCEHMPLVNIPLENVILDELHLMLRITDKLTKNLVEAALEWDKKDNLNKPPSKRCNKHIEDLVEAIRSCGLSFQVWEKTNGDGSGSGVYDFTSLMGSAKKLLLKKLPDRLKGIIKPDTEEAIIKLWKDFDKVYTLLGQKNPTDEDVEQYFLEASRWVSSFNSLGGRCFGYEKARVTPYMHSMVYHVPHFMKEHRSMKIFTGQGVEKLNDDCRRIHLQRSNKWDAPKDVLLVEKRLENLVSHARRPRPYQKHTQQYWEKDIIEKRAKRIRICQQNAPAALDAVNVENMTVEEIKKMLMEKGVKTRLRSLPRLKELLRNQLALEALQL